MAKKGKRVKYVIFGAILLLVVLGILKASGVFKSNAFEVETEKIRKRNLTELVTASGKIQPEQEVKISPDVSGEIIELSVVLGQEVKEGDLLLKIQPDIYQAAVNQAQASVNNFRAQLRAAQAAYNQAKTRAANSLKNFDRNKELLSKKIISQADFDVSEMDYLISDQQSAASFEQLQSTRFSVQSAEASLKEATDRLGRTTIYAPIEGTITSLSVEKGERVVGTNQMTGTEIMRIANLEVMEVLVEVSEIDIPRISVNDSANIEIDAFPNRIFTGIITEIAKSAKMDVTQSFNDQSSTFEVKVRLLESSYADLMKNLPQAPFMPGMSAIVDIITERKKGAIAVPILAVTTQEMEADSTSQSSKGEKLDQQEVVFLYDNGVAKRKVVKTGIQDDFYIEVLEGLEAEQEIIKGPYDAVTIFLEDGKRVEKKDAAKKGRP